MPCVVKASSGGTAGDGVGERPAELSDIMDTLRQMRPAVEEMPGYNGEEVAHSGGETQSNITAATSGEGDMLESRLRQYIDKQLEQMERRLEAKLEEMLTNRLKNLDLPPTEP